MVQNKSWALLASKALFIKSGFKRNLLSTSLLCLFLIGSECHAQKPNISQNVGKASTDGNVPPAVPASGWMREAWTGDESLYRELRASVYQASRSGRAPSYWITQYATAAQQKPTDPASQFAWAYAIYRAHYRDAPLARASEYSQAVQVLANVNSPHTYEFTRLRFILASSSGGNIYPLKLVGERLMRRVPSDAEVKSRMIDVLDDGLSDADKQQALLYAKQIIQSDPISTYGYGALAWTHYVIFLKSHKLEDGNNAVSACQQCLQRMAKDDPARPSTERFLRLILTMQSNLAKRQNG